MCLVDGGTFLTAFSEQIGCQDVHIFLIGFSAFSLFLQLVNVWASLDRSWTIDPEGYVFSYGRKIMKIYKVTRKHVVHVQITYIH